MIVLSNPVILSHFETKLIGKQWKAVLYCQAKWGTGKYLVGSDNLWKIPITELSNKNINHIAHIAHIIRIAHTAHIIHIAHIAY